MKSLLITPLFLFLTLFSYGQPVEKTLGNRVMTVDELEKIMLVIEPKVKTFSIDSFNSYFEKNLNEYRVSKNQNPLSYDKSIVKAATEQSSYCLKNG